jgi:phosphoribosylformylglycinamidine synthase
MAQTAAPEVSPPPPAPDAWRIEVWRRRAVGDPEAEHARAALAEVGIVLAPSDALRVGKGYLLSPAYERGQVEQIAADLLVDPVVNQAHLCAPRESMRDAAARHRILVMPRPGVMDPVAGTIERLLEHLRLVPHSGAPRVATYRAIEIDARLDAVALAQAAQRLFANETVEIVRIDREDLPYGTPSAGARRGRVEVPLCAADDARLHALSTQGALSLTLLEMRAIQAHFRSIGREPTACELETIAQTWSEHCKHKVLTGIVEVGPPGAPSERIDNLLASTIARATREIAAPWCVSVFEDNAGIVAFDQGHDLCIKVETHNHPSAIDPYGGAGTGIGGVIRDVLGAGLGALPIANTDAFFVGPPDLAREAVPKGSLHPRRILRGVVAGVRDYGNRMGIPTVNGGVWFDAGYTANPLVYCGTVGILPHAAARKEVRVGDTIVAVGGRTGRDGIHGATFSSIELSEHSESASGTAVQIGDPITEKRVLDCLIQARDAGLYRAITDCGAGGFSSAVGEMSERTGAEVWLERVPLKYPGLASHEVWISEAQERMVLAVPSEHVDALVALFAAEDVEATPIGRFTESGRLVVKDLGEVVADLDAHFLHRGTPRPVRRAEFTPPRLADPGCPAPADLGRALCELLARPNVSSKEWIVRQYDHEVQGRSVVKPLVGARGDGPGDAAVLQPLASSRRAAAIGCGACPTYGGLDPWAMAAAAIDEALRNVVAVGGDPARTAILDNFSWGNCDKPEQLGALVLACQACYQVALAYRTPFVSGKDSLNNEYRVGEATLSIPPTLLITALSIVPDVEQAVTMDAKRAADVLYLIGRTRAELGGSQWLAQLGLCGGRVPRPDLAEAPRLFAALHAAMCAGDVRACHDLSEGGLAVAAAELAFAGDLGVALDLGALALDALPSGYDPVATALFSESCSRFLVEVAPERCAAFEARFAGLPWARIGEITIEPRLCARAPGGAAWLDVPIDALRAAFLGGFRG